MINVPRVVSSTVTLDFSDRTVVATSGTFNVNLPNIPTGQVGQELWIKNRGAGTVTLDGNGSDNIDGATTYALAAGEGVIIQAYNTTNWSVMAKI